MGGPPGHDPGHREAAPLDAPLDAPPAGCTWRMVVDALVADAGGWAALADALVYRRLDGEPRDAATVEKGLRRLATRGHRPGGSYGRWLLRSFGVPRPIEDWARWMGQYHSRFGDLPVALRAAHLTLWDRPPLSESSAAAWIHLGLASVAFRSGDEAAGAERLARARRMAPSAGPAATIEALLFAARLATTASAVRPLLDEAEANLDRMRQAIDGSRREQPADASRREQPADGARREQPVDRDERDCYRARLLDQRAYLVLRDDAGQGVPKERIAEALALYSAIRAPAGSIPDRPLSPFAAFRHAHGSAYCFWKLGDLRRAVTCAREAVSHAGDGGYIRFRVLALDLLAHLTEGPEREALRARAERMARHLEDEELSRRFETPR